jgi:hypothetical protein
MRHQGYFLLQFIGEQAEMLAKMARIDGLEDLSFILQMAKAEADLAQKKWHDDQVNGHPSPHELNLLA